LKHDDSLVIILSDFKSDEKNDMSLCVYTII